MATSAIMNMKTQDGKDLQRSITHINPSATSQQIKELIEGINGLSTNTLTEARRVDTTSLTETKSDPELQVLNSMGGSPVTSLKVADISTSAENSTIIYAYFAGNGKISYTSDVEVFINMMYSQMSGTKKEYIIELYRYPDSTQITGTITVTTSETDTYYGGTYTITIAP